MENMIDDVVLLYIVTYTNKTFVWYWFNGASLIIYDQTTGNMLVTLKIKVSHIW